MNSFEYQNENITLLTFLVIFILFVVIMIYYFNVVVPFLDKRRYIKMEMNRSDGNEYLRWKSKLKNHYLEHIPLFGRFIRIANIKRKRK